MPGRTRVSKRITWLKSTVSFWLSKTYSLQSHLNITALHSNKNMIVVNCLGGLVDLCQGETTFTDYSIQFQTLVAECNWNMEAQWDNFLHGLADRIQNEIYALDLPTTLDDLIDLAIRVDTWLQRSQSSRLSAVERIPAWLLIRSAHCSILSPCRWAELCYPGRRGSDAEYRDFVSIVVLQDILPLSVQ